MYVNVSSNGNRREDGNHKKSCNRLLLESFGVHKTSIFLQSIKPCTFRHMYSKPLKNIHQHIYNIDSQLQEE